MDYPALARQLVRALRGRRSQLALSRWLGFDSNVVYTWESGRRWPSPANFFRLCDKVGVDLPGSMQHFLGGMPDELRDVDWLKRETAALFLDHLRGATTVVEIARRVGTNRVSVGRWLKGEAEPRLPEFLSLIEATSSRLLDFLACLTEPEKLPAARAGWSRLEAQRKVAYELPWSHGVQRVLELEQYRKQAQHDAAWIAARLGISEPEVEQCVEALADSGLIVRRGRHWVAANQAPVDTRRDAAAGRALKLHWSDVARSRLPGLEPNRRDLFSYALCSVSERDWERMRELHMGYHQELVRVITESSPAERVVLINLQLLRLDEPSVQ